MVKKHLIFILLFLTMVVILRSLMSLSWAEEKLPILLNENFDRFDTSKWIALPNTAPVTVKDGVIRIKIEGGSKGEMAGIRYKERIEFPFTVKAKLRVINGDFGLGIINKYGDSRAISQLNYEGNWWNIWRPVEEIVSGDPFKYSGEKENLPVGVYYVLELRFTSDTHYESTLYNADESMKIKSVRHGFKEGADYIYLGAYHSGDEGEVDWVKIYGKPLVRGESLKDYWNNIAEESEQIGEVIITVDGSSYHSFNGVKEIPIDTIKFHLSSSWNLLSRINWTLI